MRTVLGIDSGSSKTHALLVDEQGRAIRLGEGGCGNHQARGLQAAVLEISKAIQSACGDLPESTLPVDLACFCLAGADLEEDYVMLRQAMEALNVARSVVIKNDTMAAMRAGLTRSWGVVVICGTGFNAAVRTPDGREYVLPGLGPISGDWGGGGALSMEMIRAVMRAWDGRGQPTRLTGVVLGALKLGSPEELLRSLYQQKIPRSKILALVPLLFEAAEAGDEAARELVIKMGVETGVTARALIRRMDLGNTGVEVVLGGSVYKGKGPLLVETIKAVIHEEFPDARVIRPHFEPVVGAALLGIEALGVQVGAEVYARLEETLPERLKILNGVSSQGAPG